MPFFPHHKFTTTPWWPTGTRVQDTAESDRHTSSAAFLMEHLLDGGGLMRERCIRRTRGKALDLTGSVVRRLAGGQTALGEMRRRDYWQYWFAGVAPSQTRPASGATAVTSDV